MERVGLYETGELAEPNCAFAWDATQLEPSTPWQKGSM